MSPSPRRSPTPTGASPRAIAATRQQIDAARANLASSAKRPLVTLQSLEAANQQIDGVVQGVRDAEAQAQRARQMVGQVIMQAQAQVSAAEDYITARRGAVGAEARTRLAEAGASLVRAQQLQPRDPQQAMQHAQRADQLAGAAIQLAQNDVGAFDGGGLGGMFGGGPSYGRQGGGRRDARRRARRHRHQLDARRGRRLVRRPRRHVRRRRSLGRRHAQPRKLRRRRNPRPPRGWSLLTATRRRTPRPRHPTLVTRHTAEPTE